MARPETHSFQEAGAIPNSRLPVLVYHEVEEASDATRCEELFARNGCDPRRTRRAAVRLLSPLPRPATRVEPALRGARGAAG